MRVDDLNRNVQIKQKKLNFLIIIHIDLPPSLKQWQKGKRIPFQMSTKEVIMMALDAGRSMDQMYSETASRLKLALQCIEITLQQKIYYNPTHEVGFGIFGDADHNQDDDNFLQLHPISKPTSQLLLKMHQMSEARLDNQKAGGDIFRAIQYSIGMLNNPKYRKAKKRIFLFTNGMGETIYNESTIKQLAIEIRASEVKVNIIPINFMEGYVLEENQVETEIPNEQQLINAQLLMDLKADAEDNVQIFPDQIAIELYKRFRKREINPTAIYKGEFQIAPDLGIYVETYKFIRRERLKSLAKYDVNQPFVAEISKEKQITTRVSYIVQGDETSTEIEKENQMNAYSYGPHLIPISSILQSQAKFFEDRNLRLLGFVPKGQVARAALMGEVELMVPDKNNLASRKLFTALVFAMISTNRYAIARYVPRNSKNGVTPRLVVLIPYRSVDREGLYLIDLPTVEDVRDYPFNSLKTATDKQRQLVRDMVAKMQLHKRNDDTDIEQLKMENTFNPTHQYFYQTVFYRVIHNQGDIPTLNPEIAKYLTPELKIYEQTQQVCKLMRKEFKFVRKELAKEKAAKKQALLWKDALQNQMPVLEDKSLVSSQTGDDLKPHKMFHFEEDENEFDPANPLISFNRMLSNNKEDLVGKALQNMVEFIDSKLKDAVTDEVIGFLVQCASTMRRGCDEQQEGLFWDDWLEKGEHRLPKKLYNKIVDEGLGFLKKSNDKLYKPKSLHVQLNPGQEFGELD